MNCMNFNEQIIRIVTKPIDQGKIVAMAIALAVSSRAILPSNEVDDVATYFTNTVAPYACEAMSEIGEGVVYPSKLALDYVRQFWTLRYNSAHPGNAAATGLAYALASGIADRMESFDFGLMFSGGATIVSEETAAFLNKYKLEILQLYVVALPLLDTDDCDGDVDG